MAFHLGNFEQDVETTYQIKRKGNGVYVFLLKGNLIVNGQELAARDGFGLWNIDKLTIKSITADTEVLLMDVPMTLT